MDQTTLDNNKGIITIANVPTELINYAAKRKRANSDDLFIEGIAVWLILKSLTSSGKIKEYKHHLQALASACKITQTKLDEIVAWLATEKLITVTENTILLESYLATRKYQIKIDKRQTILYDSVGSLALSELITETASNNR